MPENVEEFLNVNYRFSDMQSQIIERISFDEMLLAEENIVKNATALIKEEADHIICLFSTAYGRLKEKGIPCTYVYPSIDTIIDTMQLLMSDIRLAQIDSDLPAVMYITSGHLQMRIYQVLIL